jgi:hypothetical protein
MKEVLAHASNVGLRYERTAGNFCGFIEISGKTMVLCEMIESTRRQDRHLHIRTGNQFDRSANGSIPAGDENPFLAALDLFGDAVL